MDIKMITVIVSMIGAGIFVICLTLNLFDKGSSRRSSVIWVMCGVGFLIMVISICVFRITTDQQLAKEGRIVTVTSMTDLTPVNYDLGVGDTVQIDLVTSENPVSVGDVVSFYDTAGCTQVGLVTAINDDTANIFMNDYNDDGTVSVPVQSIYGIATPYVEEYSEQPDIVFFPPIYYPRR